MRLRHFLACLGLSVALGASGWAEELEHERNFWPVRVSQRDAHGAEQSWQGAGPLLFHQPVGDGVDASGFRPFYLRKLNTPEATAETFVDGWVRTGDLARLDAEGFLTLVDRAKDMIIRGGENIYSIEVENVLYQYPGVIDAALIGIPHHTLGEEPAAVVHLAPGASATEEQLKAWVCERLAIFKTPVRIIFLRQPLPRNANGKILKKDLKALFGD